MRELVALPCKITGGRAYRFWASVSRRTNQFGCAAWAAASNLVRVAATCPGRRRRAGTPTTLS